MTRVFFEPQEPRLTMEGHAGAGEKGGDLVCAALSMLMMTLERRMQETAERSFPSVSRSPGHFAIACRPTEDFSALCRESFETVAAGLALLAERESAFVSFGREIEEEGEETEQ